MSRHLQDSRVFITGGGRGIGRAAALALIDAGAQVAVCSRSEPELNTVVREARTRKGRAIGVVADVADEVSLRAAIDEAEASLGPFDVLLCNAGISMPPRALWEVDAKAWWRVQEVNVLGVVHAVRAVVPGMVERGRGRVIHVASYAGARPTDRGSAYACSKAALLRLNDCLAAELQGTGVVSLAMSPGLVRTAMTEPLARHLDLPDDAWTPIERSGELIVRLAAGDADVLSGHMIHVTDDLDAMIANADEIRERGWYALRLVRGLEAPDPV